MSSKILVICDKDVKYAARLAAFLYEKRELAFQVKICESLEQLQILQDETPADVLLVNEIYAKDCRKRREEMVIILSETAVEEGDSKKKIYKYQSGENLLIQFLECCTAADVEDIWCVRKKKNGKVIGIYSPVRRMGQTRFAINKGKELSQKENVLYLNMESYAGYGGYFPAEETKNMSALLYYAKQERGNLGMILATLVKQLEGIDFVPPVLCSDDLRNITKEEWICLLSEILRNSIYDVIILDLGECIQGLYDILRFCDEIYLPVADDKIAAAKLKQYEEILCTLGYSDVAERMMRCDIRRTITRKNNGKTGFV